MSNKLRKAHEPMSNQLRGRDIVGRVTDAPPSLRAASSARSVPRLRKD
jgi:hypothetical protein